MERAPRFDKIINDVKYIEPGTRSKSTATASNMATPQPKSNIEEFLATANETKPLYNFTAARPAINLKEVTQEAIRGQPFGILNHFEPVEERNTFYQSTFLGRPAKDKASIITLEHTSIGMNPSPDPLVTRATYQKR